jgi:hypothetical protein
MTVTDLANSDRLRDPRLAWFVPWDSIGASRVPLDVFSFGLAPARPGLSFERDLLDRARHFSEPEIDHFVMAITAAEAIVRHTNRRPWPSDSVSQITQPPFVQDYTFICS